ncbi:hypothetical protein DITRI_Ditri11bG0181700 [Diplodiscus trichospermus]
MAEHLRVKIIEHCQVFAPPNSVPQASLVPLTFFDIPWLFFPPTQPLFFYPYPYPTSHFLSTTIPTLKHSLSLTLQLFFPFAGRLVILDSNSTPPQHQPQPKIAYSQNDCYSNADFHRISGNHPRDVKEFHSLVPSLESSLSSDENHGVPLLSVKVTVFSNVGLCIGLAYHHVAADGRTFDNFIKTWASFHRDSSLSIKSVPCYDRRVVIDKHGLEAIFLNEWRKKKGEKEMVMMGRERKADEFPDMVSATFVMGLTKMESIKRWIIDECRKKKSVRTRTLMVGEAKQNRGDIN